jgi:putative ABC transport system permease protein
MKNIFKLALRGLLRNRRRSLVTLLAIALGFSAIALFAGYTRFTVVWPPVDHDK